MFVQYQHSSVATMSIRVVVDRADSLPNIERFGKIDPYVSVSIQGIRKKTQVKEDTLDPVWNETLVFDLAGKLPTADEVLEIFVKDYERLGRNRLLGSACMSLRNVLSGPSEMQMALNLVDKNNQPTAAVLHLKISYTGPTAEPGAVTSTATSVIPESGQQKSVVSHPAGPGFAPSAFTPHPTDAATAANANNGNLLASTVPEKFQIRVRVVEARQLNGANLYPSCSVKAFKQTRNTSVSRATNDPIWDELFFYHTTAAPSEIADDNVQFEVSHSKFARAKALIGSFRCPVGIVYTQPRHAFINKWLLLTDPNDLAQGVTGYLKASIVVLRAGDECPDLSAPPASDKEDIETNLLWPAGVELRPATFSLDVFRAEDLPRMDSGFVQEMKKLLDVGKVHKELVDPYLIFSFAGKEVQTKILYCNDHPNWQQTLNLGFMFPSMCNNLKLTIKDWDRLSEDDTVATAYIRVPLISAAGENGFLPTFGPCFVNFYGSPREYKNLGYEFDADMNSGKTEGCAYRGRALVSLRSGLGEFPSLPSSPLDEVDTWKVEAFCRRRRFQLKAVFVDASMISEVKTPIEFEVSIGNFGNKFENTSVPSPSSTQPTNAVFDGCQYYYLPWLENKPAISVECQWEDIAFRLEAVNMIQNAISNLENGLSVIKNGKAAGKSMPDIAAVFVSTIDRLIADCSFQLPEPEPGSHPQNDLDVQLAALRRAELDGVILQAKNLRNNATNLDDALLETETYLDTLRRLTLEPQSSIPDVIIWMVSGQKRIAYRRIPAHELLFSPLPNGSGKHAGQLQTVTLKHLGLKQPAHLPAVVRLKLWLGLEKHTNEWLQQEPNTEVAVFAETYENQVSLLGSWKTKGPTMSRPPFSDASGRTSLPKDDFVEPSGWRFDGDWFIDPEMSMMYDSDAGHRMFLEDVFENQNRLPGGNWVPALTQWTDVRGDPASPRDEINCPDNWEWEDAWKYDVKRAVDEEGWEYTLEATLGGYTPAEKRYHLCRRRRWVRRRYLKVDATTEPQKRDVEGWEYSALFTSRYHAHERKMDLVRRRRWHRKMVAEEYGVVPVFNLGADKTKENVDTSVVTAMSSPRMYLVYKETHKYQLRVYIYQARDLLAGDKTGFSDPYVCVNFLSRSQTTEKIKKTLCPTWDQSLIFEEIVLYGSPRNVHVKPPSVVVELFDHDAYGEPDFLGRTFLTPVVHLEPSSAVRPKLAWHEIKRGPEEGGGEILACSELMLDEGEEMPFVPPKVGELYMVPSGIRPILQRTVIEILCWGVRNLKTFECMSISHPSIEIECGNQLLHTQYIKDVKSNPNFASPLMVVEMMLPKEELYLPPVNVKLRDHRSFGRTPIVGTHVIKSLHAFRHTHRSDDFLPSSFDMVDGAAAEDAVVNIEPAAAEEAPAEVGGKDDDVDWWSKYYASVGENQKCISYLDKGYHVLEVFPVELERVVRFQGFNDLLSTFPFTRGKSKFGQDAEVVGELKGTLRVYPVAGNPNDPLPPQVLRRLPSSAPEEVLVRVYIIRARDLAPKDTNCLNDPYVEVKLGKKKLNSRENYKPNTLNPVFGEVFEMVATLPVDKDLRVRVFDYDLLNKDDLVGETFIDLENRRLSRFRAVCGLPLHYHVSGANQWRDGKTPTQILEDYCASYGIQKPQYQGNAKLTIGSTVHNIRDYEKDAAATNRHMGPANERLALHALHTMSLVPEHIETRRLFNPAMPDMEQGKLEMWVDIFPKAGGASPSPVDITPRSPTKYFVRCVIYNTADVVLQEENIVGEKMSDIYVKGWIGGTDEIQKTDVHYRSLDGEGNFNWRFVFPMHYLPAEQMAIIKKKEQFWSLDEKETRLPPKLCIQIWDNDKFSFDDFLGQIDLNLISLPQPAKSASDCDVHQLGEDRLRAGGVYKNWQKPPTKTVNLFDKKRVYGFWPCTSNADGQMTLTGKIEMEIEVLTEEEATARPAGPAREDPNTNPRLEPPERPATSFLWFASPWKSFKFILWRRYKWYIITFIVIAILFVFLLLFLYNVPEAAIQKAFGRN